MITQEQLKNALSYSKETGQFTWRYRVDASKQWNSRNSGNLAGSKMVNGYINISVNGERYLAHRLAYLYVTGSTPSQVDHKNHVRDDNSWNNLRASNAYMNSRNQKLRSTNTSGHNGVYWCGRSSKWYVRVGFNGKNLSGGYFKSKDDAIKARKELDRKLGYFESHGK